MGGPSNIIDLSPPGRHGRTLPGDGMNMRLRQLGGTYALAALARALQTQANTNIVSTPNLMTLDNEEAKIVVGENVPFITGQFTNTGTAAHQPVPDHRAQGRRHHAAHPPADRRKRHGPRMTIYQESRRVK